MIPKKPAPDLIRLRTGFRKKNHTEHPTLTAYRPCERRASLRKMIGASDNTWLAGVDGCRGGWLAAFVRADGTDIRLRVCPRFADVAAAPEKPAVIAVDMPIGLPERTGPGGRAAENAVRPLLGARHSSVFSVPSRAAMGNQDYREACAAALQTSDPPRKISKQLFMIAPKIREVDEALRTDTALAARVFEVHPEVAFWRLNGERALDEPKKVKGKCYGPGLALRRNLLITDGLRRGTVETSPPAGAADDDLLDALACAIVARRVHQGAAQPFPDPPPRDALGLRMAIWA
jgi:predicted RNase H-like nuclease